jgi:hypothetical protein
MIDRLHHLSMPVRARLAARSKVRPRRPLSLLLSGLILIAAVAPAAADHLVFSKQEIKYCAKIQAKYASADARQTATGAIRQTLAVCDDYTAAQKLK